MLPGFRPHIAHPATDVNEGYLNEQPESKKANESAEWDCRTGCLSPNKEVQDQNKAEGQTREEKSRLEFKLVWVEPKVHFGLIKLIKPTIRVFFRQPDPPKVLYRRPEK